MKINVTEKGSLKIYNGVVSGFSASNYLEVAPSFDVSSAQSWEMVYKITTSDKITTGQTICGHTGSSTADPIAITTNTSKHFALTVSNSTSSSFINAVSGTYTMLPNTTYWLKVTFDGSKYVLSYSLDGVNFTEDVVKENTKVPYTSNLVLGRQQGSDSEFPFLGAIDLKECYIKINGELWWTGTVEGTQCVRAYGLDIKKYKYYKEVVTEGDAYKCFVKTNGEYCYVKVPYAVGDYIYSASNGALATDSSELSVSSDSIDSKNSDGSITINGGKWATKATPYSSGDLITGKIELIPSTEEDYDIRKIEDSFYSLRTKGEIKYYKEVVTEGETYECFQQGSSSAYYYAKVPYNNGDCMYGRDDGFYLTNDVTRLIAYTQYTISALDGGGFLVVYNGNLHSAPIPYPEGDLTTTTTELVESTKDDYDIIKEMNDNTYSLMRRKK